MHLNKQIGISTDIVSATDPTVNPMTDSDLEAMMGQEIIDAVSYIDSDLSPIRARGTEYYRGDHFGNEEEGRSQVVAMEVRDTVSAMLPSLMKVFFSTENTVEFVPRSPEDVENAQQATDYCNYVFNNDNNGFMVAYATFKDALVRKCGIVKVYMEERESVRIEEYSGLDDQTLQIVMQEGDTEVKIVASYPDEAMQGSMQIDPMTGQPAPQAMVHDVQIKRKLNDKRIHVVCLPPEELLLSRQAMSFKTSAFIAHRKMATVAELIGMGYDEDEVMDYVGTSDLFDNQEALARAPLANNQYYGDSNNPMMMRVLYIEAYAMVDFDGDGIPEFRKMCFMGSGYKMVRNLPASYNPFVEFPCDPEPHTSPLEAMSIFDITRDLQEIKSEVMRNTLDSLAQSIHPRTVIVEGQVNIDDALNNETGAIIRARAPNMVQPLVTPFVGQAAFPVLAYLDEIKEGRTGMSKASMGLNADALQSSTKAAVNATINASQGRLELTARLMAEGMKELFKTMLFLITTHQDKPRMIRLRNKWVQIDPRAWDNTMDVNINIGLGNGDTNERIATLMQILAKQESIINQYGLENPVVSPQMYVRTLKKVVELSGFKDASSYFADIPDGWKAPQAPQKPTPEEVLAQVQAESIKADIQKKAADLELQRQKMIRDDDFRRDQMNQDRLLRQYELELKYNTQVSTAQIVAEQNVNREVVKEQSALVQQAMAQPQQAPMQPINPQGMV